MTPRRTTPLGFALDCAGWVGIGLLLFVMMFFGQ